MKIAINTELQVMDEEDKKIVEDPSWYVGELSRSDQVLLSRGLAIRFAKQLQKLGLDMGVVGGSLDSASVICFAIKNGDTSWEDEEY